MKRLRKRLNKHGMSLAEVLVVVALIAILGGVSTIEVVKYRRSLKQFELDGFAKEIFLTAQNNLSMAKGQNYLGITDGFGNPEEFASLSSEDDTAGGNYYYIVKPETGMLSDSTSLLSLMLPFGSIEDTVRLGGNYVIRYHKDSGTVLDVFYFLNSDQKFGHDFAKSEYAGLLAKYPNYHDFGGNDVLVGYYGGADAQSDGNAARLRMPSITLINGDTLSVTIYNPNASVSQAKLYLEVEGVASGKTERLELTNVSEYTFVLDDIRTEGSHFANQFTDLYPGENIRVKAVSVIENDDGTVEKARAESAQKETNSLFADLNDVTNTAGITSFRHLENLSCEISHLDSRLGIEKAEQYSDLRWSDFISGAAVTTVGSGSGGTGMFLPINVTDGSESAVLLPIYYDGKGHTISGVTVSSEGNAGLFGTLKGSAVNLILEGFDITSGKASAGALAGSLVNGTVENVLVYNKQGNDTAIGVNAELYAGGLVGTAEDSEIKGCAASVYVISEESAAGGFAGFVSGGKITESYSGGHTYAGEYRVEEHNPEAGDQWGTSNVLAKKGAAGGFAGVVSGTEISVCYSTASSFGEIPAGFIGNVLSGSVTYCYSTGLVNATGSATTVQPFVNTAEGASPTYSGNRYVKCGSYASPAAISGNAIEMISQESSPEFFLSSTAAVPAYCYDQSLVSKFKGLYSYPTISAWKAISGVTGGSVSDAVKVHYGDWQLPSGTVASLNYVFISSDTLYLKVDLSDLNDENGTHSSFTLWLKGVQEGAADVALLIDVADSSKPVITNAGMSNGNSIVWNKEDPALAALITKLNTDNLTYVDEGSVKYVYLTLDDVTREERHFAEIFADAYNGKYFTPGDNIDTCIVKDKADAVAVFQKFDHKFQNSLYASGSSISKANISVIRHLQNLDPLISGVTVSLKEAYLIEDIRLDTEKYPQIYNLDHSDHTTGTLYPMYNPSLTLFDGGGHTIEGVTFLSAHEEGAESSASGSAPDPVESMPLASAGLLYAGTPEETVGEPSTVTGPGSDPNLMSRETEYPWLTATGPGAVNLAKTAETENSMGDIEEESLEEASFLGTGAPASGSSGKLVSGSGNAGLFRMINTGMTVKDLRLDNVTVTATGGHAGTVAGYVTGAGKTTSINTVLVTGDTTAVTATGTDAAAGGLIGYVETGFAVTNSAASVLVDGASYAGGLIGRQLMGTGNIETSFAGGHTVTDGGDVVYDTTDYNITSGSASGGLIGYAQGTVNVTKSFNAASVESGFAAGGIFGKTTGAVTLDTVYTIAPVAGTIVEADSKESSSRGAFIGVISDSSTVERAIDTETGEPAASYYLPEVFEGNVSIDGESSVHAIGTGTLGSGANSWEVSLAYYEKDTETNAISAKINNETMQIRTYPYNDDLVVNGYGSNNEYPFSIWTSFDFDDEAYDHGTYYGDWQPINPYATVLHQVTFKYKDPYTGVVKLCQDKNLTLQNIKERQDNKLLTPYVEHFAGYEIDYWELRKAEDDPDSELSNDQKLEVTNGYVTIPKAYSYYDCVLTAHYRKLDNVFVVFYYNQDHKYYDNFALQGTSEYQNLKPEQYFTQIGSSMEIDLASGKTYADIPVPSRIINGYTFEGWYSDPQFEHAIDFTSTEAITEGIKAYAKYVKTEFFTVTIDFFYMTDEGEMEELRSIPRYSYDGVAEYKIRCVRGTTFDRDVNVPIPAGALKLEYAEYYNTSEGTEHHGTISMIENPTPSTGSAVLKSTETVYYDNLVHITATDDERFIMVYLARPDNLVEYKVYYRMQESELSSASEDGFAYNKNNYVDVLKAEELYAPAGSKPQVVPEYLKGFVYPETADIYNYYDPVSGTKRLDPLLTDAGSYTQTIYVDYFRDEYILSFDSRKGSYVEPVLVKYGAPLINSQPDYPVLAGYTPDMSKGGSGSIYTWVTIPGGTYTGQRYRDNQGHTTEDNGDGLYGKVEGSYVPLICTSKEEEKTLTGTYSGTRYKVSTNGDTRLGFYNGSMVTIYKNNNKWWRTRTGNAGNRKYSDEYTGTVYQEAGWTETSNTYGIIGGDVRSLTFVWDSYVSGHYEYSYTGIQITYTYTYASFDVKKPVECPGGWIIVDDGTPYTEGMEYKYTWLDTMPANDLIAYITWAKSDANYTVIYWKQDVNDDKNATNEQKTYLVDKVVTQTALTGSSVTGSSISRPEDNKSGSFGDYIGFKYNATNSDTAAKTIASDGTTVFNIRYDRKLITMHFKDGNKEYEGGTSDKKTVEIDGVLYDLYQKDGKYYYSKTTTYFKEYTGDRYVKGNDCSIYSDAIGVTDDGREVTIEYTWHKGKGKGWKWYLKGKNESFKGQAYYQKSSYGMYYRKAAGQFERLETNGGKVGFWVTEEQEIQYTGDIPEGEKIKSPYTGLYGQSLAQNGYQWPVITSGKNKYVWKDGNTIMSYLGQFVLNPRTDEEVTYVKDTTSSATIYFYLEDENGIYRYDAQGVVSSSNNGFTLSNKYDGYQFRYWKKEYPGDQFNTSNATRIDGYPEEGSVSGSYTNLSIAFERKEVGLSFYNTTDNEVCTESGFEATTVKFGKSLESKLSAMKELEPHAADPSYVWDGNFYLDSNCETLCDISTLKMPQTALTLYLKFILPNHYISFDLNDTDDMGNRPEPAAYKAETDLDRQNIVVVENQTITDKVANEISEGNFEWKDEFIPERKKVTADGTVEYEYTFRGWYYEKDGVETKFILGQGIKADLDLYAVWKQGPPTEYGTIIQHFIYKDAEGHETELTAPKTITNVEVGTVTELWADDIEGYWPNEMVKYTVVKSADKDENVTFYYNKVQPWKYDVEYYAVYDSYVDLTADQKTALGVTPASAPTIIKISQPKDAVSVLPIQTENVQAYNNYESVQFSMPYGYDKYSLVGYTFEEYAEETAAGLPKPAAISDSSYKTKLTRSDVAVIGDPGKWVSKDDTSIQGQKKGLLRYYIALDQTKTEVTDRYSVYNGLNQSEKDSLEGGTAITGPANVSLQYIYSYFKADGTPVTAGQIVDAGAYKMNAWVMAEVGEGTSAKTYVLWENVSKTLNLRINPRSITVTSGDAMRDYQKNSPLTNQEMTMAGPNDGEGYTTTARDANGRLYTNSFIGEDWKRFTYAFSVEAFRQDYGQAQNSFTWEFVKINEDTADDLKRIKNNYSIITKFGNLVIPWYYTADYYSIYESKAELTAEEAEDLGVALSEKQVIELGSVSNIPVDTKNKTVSCSFPADEGTALNRFRNGYQTVNWVYKHGTKEVKNGTGTMAAIDFSQTSDGKFDGKLEIYAEVNPAKASFANRIRKADGRTQAEVDAEEASVTLPAPDGYTVVLTRVYRYFDGHKQPITATEVSTAGIYYVNGYEILTLTKTDSGEQYTYLLNKKTDQTMTLTIQPNL